MDMIKIYYFNMQEQIAITTVQKTRAPELILSHIDIKLAHRKD